MTNRIAHILSSYSSIKSVYLVYIFGVFGNVILVFSSMALFFHQSDRLNATHYHPTNRILLDQITKMCFIYFKKLTIKIFGLKRWGWRTKGSWLPLKSKSSGKIAKRWIRKKNPQLCWTFTKWHVFVVSFHLA